jgi:hypothetical protein
MNRNSFYLLGSAVVLFLNRYQQVSITPRHAGVLVQHQYMVSSQLRLSLVCVIVCICLRAMARNRSSQAGISFSQMLRWRYALYALPAFVYSFGGESFSGQDYEIVIYSGFGGPHNWVLFIAAGLMFVCIEAYCRALEAVGRSERVMP